MKTKSILFIIIYLTINITSVFSQTTILSENFEGGVLPSGWTRSQASGSQGWEIGSNLGSTYFPIPSHTVYACSNDDNCNCNMSVDYLITPSINLSSYYSTVLKFDGIAPGSFGSTAHIKISTNNGASWTNVYNVPASSEWKTYYISISSYCGSPNVKIAFHHNDNGQWGDGFAVDNVVVYQPIAKDIELTELTMNDYYPEGNLSVKGKLTNMGADTIHSVVINWQLNGGAVNSYNITGINMPTMGSYNFTHNAPVNLQTPDYFSLKVWSSMPDGVSDMYNDNDTLTKYITALSSVPEKNVLVEEFTGAWCQYCPDGTVTLEQLLANNPKAIGAAIHDDDGMQISEGATVISAYMPSFPMGMVDRFKFSDQPEVPMDRDYWAGKASSRASAVVPVAVTATNTYDVITRNLNINISATFYGEAHDDFRFNCYIVEDSVSGTGSQYNQANYYNTVSGHPFYGAGNPIIGFKHRHVVRKMLGGAWGSSGNIPNIVYDGQSFSKSYSLTVPSSWKPESIRLIAIVQKYNTDIRYRNILNAKQYPLNYSSTGISEKDEASCIKIYPNPANEIIYINLHNKETENIDISIYDNYGQKVMNNAYKSGNTGEEQIKINTSGLSQGIYFIKIATNTDVFTRKIFIAR